MPTEPPPPKRRSTRPPPATTASGRPPSIPSGAPGAGRASTRPPHPLVPSSLRLSATDFDLVTAARHIIEDAFALVPGERLLVLHDAPRRDIADALWGAAEDVGARVMRFDVGLVGARPLTSLPPALVAEMRQAEASLLVVGRDEAEAPFLVDTASEAAAAGLRHAEMIGTRRRGMIAGFAVDKTRIVEMGRKLRDRLQPGALLRVRSPAGTDLEVRLPATHRWWEHTDAVRGARATSLPHASLASHQAHVRGIFVADASVGTARGEAMGLLGPEALRLEIEGSMCLGVQASDSALQRSLESLIRVEPSLARVGAVHFGVHVGLLDAIGEIATDLTLPGIHLSLGNRGGEGPFPTRVEVGLAGQKADVDVDGVPLVRAGRIIIT
jgi:leucyl aminopeptidase (aminopeptidase T)